MNRSILVVLAVMLFASPTRADGSSLVEAARAQVGRTIGYDPACRRIAYPMGDVPIERGVCTDVVVRAFRAVGIVSERWHPYTRRPLILHNIGAGAREEDILLAYRITGHFRWF